MNSGYYKIPLQVRSLMSLEDLPKSNLLDSINQYLKQFAESPSDDRIGEILIIEDGGFFVPAIHREFTQLIPHVIGAVEQTTRGIFNAEV